MYSTPLYVNLNEINCHLKIMFRVLSEISSWSIRPFVVCYWTVIFFLKIFKFCNVHIDRFEITPGICLSHSYYLNLSLMHFEKKFQIISTRTKKYFYVCAGTWIYVHTNVERMTTQGLAKWYQQRVMLVQKVQKGKFDIMSRHLCTYVRTVHRSHRNKIKKNSIWNFCFLFFLKIYFYDSVFRSINLARLLYGQYLDKVKT